MEKMQREGIKRVDEFRYIGSAVLEDWSILEEYKGMGMMCDETVRKIEVLNLFL